MPEPPKSDGAKPLRPALFLDRDDTLVSDEGYVGDPSRIRPLSCAAGAVRAARAGGFALYLVTNQSGIGRGFYSMDDAVACNRRLEELLFGPGRRGFDGVCIAPERPDEPSRYRKPSPAYLLERIAEDSLDPALCFMIGDKVSDLLCGIDAGVHPMLVARGASGSPRQDAAAFAAERGVPVFRDVAAAVESAVSTALLSRARAGDEGALAQLCESCRKSVCAYLSGSGLVSQDEAEDVFMDAFLRARRAILSYQGGASFATWLTAIARNLALDRRRTDANRPVLALDADTGSVGSASEPSLSRDFAFPAPSEAPVPGEDMDEEARNAIVRNALLELPGKTREALVMYHLRDKSYAEISKVLGIPIGTVMSRIHNGRKALARRLGPHLRDFGFG